MTVVPPHHGPKPPKRARRSATTVLAGDFDVRPPRDVLTSLLNGVGLYTPLHRTDDDEIRRQRKREKKERERERKRALLASRAIEKPSAHPADAAPVASVSALTIAMPQPSSSTNLFWRARPSIHIATMQRSVSVTPPPFTSPPPLPSTPASTPGPSNSSSTSRTSSKRPRTPDDDEELVRNPPPRPAFPPKKPRAAARKGWKGWVDIEDSPPPPSDKLINLDAVPVLQERRTRSGKNFDAIGVGKEGWV